MRAPSKSALFAGTAVAAIYLVAYLFAIGDLNPRSALDFDVRLTSVAWDRVWQRRFGLQFEGIAIVALPGLTWLVSPLNLVIATLLGALVGINAVLGFRGFRNRQCRIGGTTATLATVPALLSGAACCAPVTLLLLGVPATASVMGLFSVLTLFQWLVPVAAAMLIASAVSLHRRGGRA